MWMECDLTLKEIQKIDPNYTLEHTNKPIGNCALIKYKDNVLANINGDHCYWYLKGIYSGLVNKELFK